MTRVRFRFWEDKSLRQQALCFFLAMGIFLPLGLRVLASVRACLPEVVAKQPALKAEISVAAVRTKAIAFKAVVAPKQKARKRFLALHTKSRLSLFALEADGSIGPKPTDVLQLNSIQDPALDDFYQGSQLVVHPNLNVLYECCSDSARRRLSVHSYSFDLNGRLTRLEKSPFEFDTSSYPFRGDSSGIRPCFDPTGTYLYFTEGSIGGETGQAPEILYFRVDAHGKIEEHPMAAPLELPRAKFYGISLEPGKTGSDDLYVTVSPCETPYNQRTAYHCKVFANGSLKIDSQVETDRMAIAREQSSERFLRADSTWGHWEGLHLDQQGQILEAYHWPTSGVSLYELMPGYALGLRNSAQETEACLYRVSLDDDRPEASSVRVSVPRIYTWGGKALSDAESQQVLFFSESQDRGIELTRVGLKSGRLRSFGPQKLSDGPGDLSSSSGKVQFISIY